MASDVLASETLTTVQGEELIVSADNGAFVDASEIIVTDVVRRQWGDTCY